MTLESLTAFKARNGIAARWAAWSASGVQWTDLLGETLTPAKRLT
jgi:hypothetical protein